MMQLLARLSRRSVAPLNLAAILLLAACDIAPPEIVEAPPPSATPPTAQPTHVVSIPIVPPAGDIPDPGATAYPAPAESVILPALSPLPAPDLAFDSAQAFKHVEAQMQWVPRDTGTTGWQQTGDYIIAQTQAAGWTVEEQRFDYRGVNVRNIIAKRGSGPLLIMGAHYDTRKYADRDPDPARQRDPVPGANDAASGVAVLLELARHIDTDKLGREVWLAFFDAEDNGEIDGWEWTVGSNYMAQNLPRKPEALVLLDMIGDADLQIYYEQTSTPALSESIWATAAQLGYKQFIPLPKHAMTDDHTPFLQQGIPAVDLIDFDYPPWHTVADTTDKVSTASLEAVGHTVEHWLETRAQP